MPASESFDAFYARTVWNVTGQMHAIAGDDSAADHAIREAYARAYQQWYEVSGYRDSEAWVFGVAKDAYERRRAEVAGAPDSGPDPDSGTWPGIYRPRRVPTAPSDPEATLAPQPGARQGGVNQGGVSQGGVNQGGQGPGDFPQADPGHDDFVPGGFMNDSAARGGSLTAGGVLGGARRPGDFYSAEMPGAAGPDAFIPSGGIPTSAIPVGEGPTGSMPNGASHRGVATGRRRPAGQPRPWLRLGDRPIGGLVAIAALTAVALVIGAAYLVFGHQGGGRAPSPPAAGPRAKPVPHMLPEGRVGSRAAIPWPLIGPGWTLAEFSTATPTPNGLSASGGSVSTYLVDPEGGRYLIGAWPGGGNPALLAWSGNKDNALYADGSNGASGYSVLSLRSGQITNLALPAGVSAVGFTRPDGLNILAVHEGPVRYQLERYNLAGVYQVALATLRKPTQPGAPIGSGALNSPDGLRDVWGIAGDEMQLVSNRGGLIRKLHVPGSGTPPSCVPISWWDDQTVLANCAVTGSPQMTRLWLVPENGSMPTPLTPPSGSPAGVGFLRGGWQAGSQTYVNRTSARQCPQAASGPLGMDIVQVAQDAIQTQVTVAQSTDNYSAVVAGVGAKLLVLAQTGCPGSSSLLWLTPSTGTTQMLVPVPSTEVGFIAAVPFGSGPTAVTDGLS